MRKLLALVVVIAGCGGSGGKGGGLPGNTTTAPETRGDPWAAVVKGATFTVDNKIEGEADVETLVATVTDVVVTGDRRVIKIAWTANGQPLDSGELLPEEVTVGATTVAFSGYEFPLATKVELDDGRYVWITDDGATCYGDGPPPASEEICGDVCDAQLCVHPQHGIIGGMGTWWPNYAGFERPDLRK